ncbi:hypothetical protein AAF712_002502 [Marasmius tenuissimus]|uniref:F-box domain-containing protein n=1 Tax=Marasmius tenuissimus TaxID=585030 RepID=A0ABR3A9W7_9AGAR
MSETIAAGLRRSSRLRTRPLRGFEEASNPVEGMEEREKDSSNRRSLKRSRDEESDDPVISQMAKKRSKTCRQKGKIKKLGILPALPLNVLYIILGYVNPKALVSLTRVNRAFRATLLSPETTSIWTQVRGACVVPEPWEKMNEVEWARLLFGSTNCQVGDPFHLNFSHFTCGTKGVYRVDFILMRGVCFVCIQARGVSRGRSRSLYTDKDKDTLRLALDLIEPTSGGEGASSTKHYNKQEIERVLARILGCSGNDDLRAYVKEREEYLGRFIVHADICKI